MTCLVKVLAGISLSAFTVAALVGFTKKDDRNTFWSKRAVCIKERLKKIIKWRRFHEWLDKPYSLTTIGLYLGFALGILSIAFSCGVS